MFFLDALYSKEEEPILVLDDSTKIFEIEDYSLFLENSYILWIIYLFILFIFLNILLYIQNILYVFYVGYSLLSENSGKNAMYIFLTKGPIPHQMYLKLYSDIKM